jgi:hemoglobin
MRCRGDQLVSACEGVYAAFGGKTGLAALMDDFVDRLVIDSRTTPFFEQADLDNLKTQLTEQLARSRAGPATTATGT